MCETFSSSVMPMPPCSCTASWLTWRAASAMRLALPGKSPTVALIWASATRAAAALAGRQLATEDDAVLAARLVLGLLRLGRLAQYVPQPVLAGFMNGVSLLILLAQIPVLTGIGQGGLQPATLLLGLGTAAATWAVARRWPSAPATSCWHRPRQQRWWCWPTACGTSRCC